MEKRNTLEKFFSICLLDAIFAMTVLLKWVSRLSRTFHLLPFSLLFLAASAAPMSAQLSDQSQLAPAPQEAQRKLVWTPQRNARKQPDFHLDYTQIVPGPANVLAFQANTSTSNVPWNGCLTVPPGLLKAGKSYAVTLNYEIISSISPDCYFYAFARSQKLGYGADRWQRWKGHPGERGTATLRIYPRESDYGIVIGIHNQGAMRFSDVQVAQGNGWKSLALDRTAGGAPPPLPPLGAKPFKVDPPALTGGPTVNLASFSPQPGYDAPVTAAEDSNLAALNAAVTKCRETHASRLIIPKGIYRIASGKTIHFSDVNDLTVEGNGSTFLFDRTTGGHGIVISKCNRTIFHNFNLDWDWQKDPLASIGRVLAVAPDKSSFDMRFEKQAPLEPKRWLNMLTLDEKLRVPGAGPEFGGINPRKIEALDEKTVRVWPAYPMAVEKGKLYLLRHYVDPKHGIVMSDNTHLSLQDITVFSFPGIAFLVGGDQHHMELLRCRITFPDNERRPCTTTSDGFHVGQSQGFIRLQDCDFAYNGDDCVNIHDNIHAGVERIADHMLMATKIVGWSCPFSPGDTVEIRNSDMSPTGFSGRLSDVKQMWKEQKTLLTFDQALPAKIDAGSILFNHRYGSHNCIITHCYFHENRARGVLCNTADWLIEDCRFFHNQHAGLHLTLDIGSSWKEGFGAQNVIVRNNQFEDENCLGTYDGAVVMASGTIYGCVTRYPVVSGILFENNLFRGMPGPVMQLSSFQNIVFRRNKVLALGPLSGGQNRGSISADNGKGLWVEENQWTYAAGAAPPAVLADPFSSSEIIVRGNSNSSAE